MPSDQGSWTLDHPFVEDSTLKLWSRNDFDMHSLTAAFVLRTHSTSPLATSGTLALCQTPAKNQGSESCLSLMSKMFKFSVEVRSLRACTLVEHPALWMLMLLAFVKLITMVIWAHWHTWAWCIHTITMVIWAHWHGHGEFTPVPRGRSIQQAGHTFLCPACRTTSTALMMPDRLKHYNELRWCWRECELDRPPEDGSVVYPAGAFDSCLRCD